MAEYSYVWSSPHFGLGDTHKCCSSSWHGVVNTLPKEERVCKESSPLTTSLSWPLLGLFGKSSAHTQGLGLGSGRCQSLELRVMWNCQGAASEGWTSFIRTLPLATSLLVWLVLPDDSPIKASVYD